MDFSGFIKIYLHKFNEEIKESIKDKSIKDKEAIVLEKLTSLFLSKYIPQSAVFKRALLFTCKLISMPSAIIRFCHGSTKC